MLDFILTEVLILIIDRARGAYPCTYQLQMSQIIQVYNFECVIDYIFSISPFNSLSYCNTFLFIMFAKMCKNNFCVICIHMCVCTWSKCLKDNFIV